MIQLGFMHDLDSMKLYFLYGRTVIVQPLDNFNGCESILQRMRASSGTHWTRERQPESSPALVFLTLTFYSTFSLSTNTIITIFDQGF